MVNENTYGIDIPTNVSTPMKAVEAIALSPLNDHSRHRVRHRHVGGGGGIEHFTGPTETDVLIPDEVLEAVEAAGVFVEPNPRLRPRGSRLDACRRTG